MDNKIKEYREKHPQCIYCKYLKYKCLDVPGCYHDWLSCELKNKTVPEFKLHWRTFCKYYEVKNVK